MKKYDFLVIGGGIAGLTYALEVAKHGTVAVLFKKGIEEYDENITNKLKTSLEFKAAFSFSSVF